MPRRAGGDRSSAPTGPAPAAGGYGGGIEPVTVYAHPTCSKSRAALELVAGRGVAYLCVDYLATPLTATEIDGLLERLGEPASALVRTDDDRFSALGLSADDVASRDGVVALLVAHPELLERPVVVVGDRAVVARPPERAGALLDEVATG